MTNIVEFETRAAVERQAREWLIRLDGDAPLNADEVGALREWMAGHPSHRQELTRISRFWNRANVLTELAVPLKRTRRSSFTRFVPVTVSVLVAALILVSWSLQRPGGAANGTYGTAIGRQQTIALRDGSSIQLNTDSQVQIGYSARSRKIRLLRGEALFSVVPDPARPFDVYAGQGVVRALGTAFTVHLADRAVDVTVTKGVVEVKEANEASARDKVNRILGQLKAGQMTTYSLDTPHLDVHELPPAELRRRMAWQEGYLAFSGEPLSEVVEQVNRYSPVTLTIADPRLASIAVGGRFRIGDLDAVLGVLRTDFGIQSSQIDERTIRLESARRR